MGSTLGLGAALCALSPVTWTTPVSTYPAKLNSVTPMSCQLLPGLHIGLSFNAHVKAVLAAHRNPLPLTLYRQLPLPGVMTVRAQRW